MNLLLLGGNSKRNEAWINSTADSFRDGFDSCRVLAYDHWAEEGNETNFELEYKKLITLSSELGHFGVFAKSLGTLLTLKGVAEKTIKPSFCLLVGLPLGMVLDSQMPVEQWLQEVDIPVIIAQNTTDPLGSYGDVLEFVSRAHSSRIRVVELRGNTHEYNDVATMKSLLTELQK